MIIGAVLLPIIFVVIFGLYFRLIDFIVKLMFPCSPHCIFQGMFSFWIVVITIVSVGVVIKQIMDN